MSGALSTLTNTAEQYLQCSFRGVPFVVVGTGGAPGRKIAVHDYPFGDQPWGEDLGRKGRLYRIRGFVNGPMCQVQRDLLVIACETKGTGLLVHPSLGAIQAVCLRFEWRERDECTGVIDLEFEFLEQSSYLSSTIVAALHAAIGVATIAYNAAATSDYTSTVATPLAAGSVVASAAVETASAWSSMAVGALSSPQAYGAAVATVPGNNGRYTNLNAGVVDSAATVSGALAALTASRDALDADATAISGEVDAGGLAAAILAVPDALRGAIADPGTQIALLSQLAVYAPSVLPAASVTGDDIVTVRTATAALCRQAALLSIAVACSNWQPTSSNEAQVLRQRIGSMLDAEATIAADAGCDATWQALRALRAIVLQDLADRAAQLPDIITVTRNAPLPALVLAQQIYADATRTPDVIQRANPIHPAFMPTSFEVLSS